MGLPGQPGRPHGALSDRTVRLREIFDKIIPDEPFIRLLHKLAREGDGKVAVHIAERKWGRMPLPIEGPPALPPFVLMIGTNGGHVALGYNPQGIVPGMETFMPPEVKALPAPAG